MELKHFVTFYTNAAINNIEETCELKSNELKDLNIPEKAFAFKTFHKATDDITRGKTKLVSKGDILNEKTYYIGKIMSIEDIKSTYGEDSTAYRNLIKNNDIGAVLTRDNFLIPLEQNCKVNIIAPEDIGIVCFTDELEQLC